MSVTENILAVIPARGGSKGIPGKNIRSLCGRPLISYSCEAALASRHVTRTIVSTDDATIADIAASFGVEVPFMRCKELALDTTPTIDVLVDALQWLKSNEGYLPSIVVLLQPTTPLRTHHHIDEAIERLTRSAADSVVSVCAVPAHYHPDWQLKTVDGELRLFNDEPLTRIVRRRQDLSSTMIRNGAIYATRSEVIMQNSLYGAHCLAYEMPAELSVNIDTIADWQLAEAALRNQETFHATR